MKRLRQGGTLRERQDQGRVNAFLNDEMLHLHVSLIITDWRDVAMLWVLGWDNAYSQHSEMFL